MGYTDEKRMQTPINLLGAAYRKLSVFSTLWVLKALRETLRCVIQIEIHFLPNMENFSSSPCK